MKDREFVRNRESAILAGKPHANPLDVAIALRDQDVIDMVETAIRRRNVMLAYQPVVRAAQPDQVAFYEGLLRVLDEAGRIIPARDFISRVEQGGLGRHLDTLALELGLDALARTPALRLAINMSARSIGNALWLQVLDDGLSRDPTLGERLILEITESSAIEMPEQVAAFMARMQSRGVSFALDDFGAGYTSFRYLRDFYFDILKIDGQFISGIDHDPDNQVLMAALLSIAEHFEMLTVAECVETAAEAAYLTHLGIDCLQGYHFGAPAIAVPWQRDGPRNSRRA
ncbi:EAL domain-containing protein [Paenirhodobacter enshiensis]|uniref:Diguanylate phosphodiesterase n=1 Tax=Paenirhodobacter enshiensis TaxID=1105367 RepID=A0A086XSL4_9RHOB|nr:EAL domain-containing protein [Paenirhodobacter enshiensis]KFI25014.1 diguanylate phosphodiesterase [Paenirhodobacter enshiensis]